MFFSLVMVNSFLSVAKSKNLQSPLTPQFLHIPHLNHQQILSALLGKTSKFNYFLPFPSLSTWSKPWSPLGYYSGLLTGPNACSPTLGSQSVILFKQESGHIMSLLCSKPSKAFLSQSKIQVPHNDPHETTLSNPVLLPRPHLVPFPPQPLH